MSCSLSPGTLPPMSLNPIVQPETSKTCGNHCPHKSVHLNTDTTSHEAPPPFAPPPHNTRTKSPSSYRTGPTLHYTSLHPHVACKMHHCNKHRPEQPRPGKHLQRSSPSGPSLPSPYNGSPGHSTTSTTPTHRQGDTNWQTSSRHSPGPPREHGSTSTWLIAPPGLASTN
jgi:hypothetical protein